MKSGKNYLLQVVLPLGIIEAAKAPEEKIYYIIEEKIYYIIPY
jgi:hypothetical protein